MQIKTDEIGFQYFPELPTGFKTVRSPSEFYVLKHGKRKFIRENIDIAIGGEILVYSEHSARYYLRKVNEWTDPYESTALTNLINKGRVYIKYPPEIKSLIQKQYTSSGLVYESMININDLTLQLEYLEKYGKYEGGFLSHKKRMEEDIKRLSLNKRIKK